MAIAIVGLSPSESLAPWDDIEHEKWGLPWSGYWAQCDRLFEMLCLELLHRHREARPLDYFDKLASVWVPLYMQEAYPDFPCRVYPFEAVAETTGAYWNSSIGYMLALAIHEGHPQIDIYGVDMKADEEYFYQRPNIEYLIGLARGKGRIVTLHESSVCRFIGSGISFGKHSVNYPERYGQL